MISNLSGAPSSGQNQNDTLKIPSSRRIGCALLKPVMLVLKTGEEAELEVVWIQDSCIDSSVDSEYFGNYELSVWGRDCFDPLS